MNEALEACPYCGGKPDLVHSEKGYSVICPWLHCLIRPETAEYSTPEEAAAVWNRRGNNSKKIKALYTVEVKIEQFYNHGRKDVAYFSNSIFPKKDEAYISKQAMNIAYIIRDFIEEEEKELGTRTE